MSYNFKKLRTYGWACLLLIVPLLVYAQVFIIPQGPLTITRPLSFSPNGVFIKDLNLFLDAGDSQDMGVLFTQDQINASRDLKRAILAALVLTAAVGATPITLSVDVDVTGGTLTANQGNVGAQSWLVRDGELSGKSYVYKSQEVTVAATAVTLVGTGSSWVVRAVGGEATINIAGGESIRIPSGLAIGDEFNLAIVNPVVNVTALDAGATAFVLIAGVN